MLMLILLRWGKRGLMRKRSPGDELKTVKGVPVSDSPIVGMDRVYQGLWEKKKMRGKEVSQEEQDSRVADCWVEVK